MAFVHPKDRVLEHSTTNSATVWAVSGAIDTSYYPFSQYMSVGDTTWGNVVEPGVAFASGLLTYSNTNEITMTTVHETKGTFGAGTKDIFMGPIASQNSDPHGATGKTTPDDADEMALVDSAAGSVIKSLTWANINATLKTYFDTLYAALGGATFTGAIQVTTIEVGPASDTTISRVSAGVIAVESDTVAMLAAAQTFSAKQSFTNTVWLQRALEKVTIAAGPPSSTTNYDAVTQSIVYYTSANTTNWTLNVRGDSGASLDSIMATGESKTVALIVTNTGTAYYSTALTIDGGAVTPQWLGAAAPAAGTISKRDTYTYTIIKTGSATFIVQASFAAGN